jgi:hypothetical protein
MRTDSEPSLSRPRPNNRIWSGRSDSNTRPPAPHAVRDFILAQALTIGLSNRPARFEGFPVNELRVALRHSQRDRTPAPVIPPSRGAARAYRISSLIAAHEARCVTRVAPSVLPRLDPRAPRLSHLIRRTHRRDQPATLCGDRVARELNRLVGRRATAIAMGPVDPTP